jgi:ketosteroid isomerase-like protein
MSDDVKDRLDIVELALKWSAAASRMDARGLGQIFTEHGVLAGVAKLAPGWGQDDLIGPKAIEGFFSEIFTGLSFVHHTSQVVELEVRGDVANCRTMIVEYARLKTGNLLVVIGDYLDQMARTPQGWRFTRRELVTKAWTFLSEIPTATFHSGVPAA